MFCERFRCDLEFRFLGDNHVRSVAALVPQDPGDRAEVTAGPDHDRRPKIAVGDPVIAPTDQRSERFLQPQPGVDAVE